MHPFSELSIPQGSVGIHWFEQNAYALKDSHGVVALIDPYFPHVRPAEKFIHPQPPVNESELRTDEDLTSPVAALKPDIGFLTTHPTEGEFPFFDGSVQMARNIGLKTAVPSHYACFVKRTFDPKDWAARFPPDGPKPLIIPCNSHVVYGSRHE